MKFKAEAIKMGLLIPSASFHFQFILSTSKEGK